MAIVSFSRGYLFLQAPRTACSATAKVLVARLDGKVCPPDHIVDSAGRRVVHRKHAYLSTLIEQGVLGRGEASSLLTFSTVRNPWDREVSLYSKMRGAPYDRKLVDAQFHLDHPADVANAERARAVDFSEWVVRRWCRRTPFGLRVDRTRYPMLAAGGHARETDVAMRFESLQPDFDEVLRSLGVTERHEIPFVNPTAGRGRDHRPYYSDRAREVVARVFAYDIERFGYEF